MIHVCETLFSYWNFIFFLSLFRFTNVIYNLKRICQLISLVGWYITCPHRSPLFLPLCWQWRCCLLPPPKKKGKKNVHKHTHTHIICLLTTNILYIICMFELLIIAYLLHMSAHKLVVFGSPSLSVFLLQCNLDTSKIHLNKHILLNSLVAKGDRLAVVGIITGSSFDWPKQIFNLSHTKRWCKLTLNDVWHQPW